MKTIREKIAELEHDQWIAWSKNIAETEQITPARRERWEKLWLPYDTLTEEQKDQDREWADKVGSIMVEVIDSMIRDTGKAPGDDAVSSEQRAFGSNCALNVLKELLLDTGKLECSPARK